MSVKKAKVAAIAEGATHRRKQLREASTAPQSASAELQALQQAWKEEVETLKTKTFSSMDDAINAVVEQVVRRLGSDEETAEFLRLMLSTDQTLQNSLQGVIKIRAHKA